MQNTKSGKKPKESHGEGGEKMFAAVRRRLRNALKKKPSEEETRSHRRRNSTVREREGKGGTATTTAAIDEGDDLKSARKPRRGSSRRRMVAKGDHGTSINVRRKPSGTAPTLSHTGSQPSAESANGTQEHTTRQTMQEAENEKTQSFEESMKVQRSTKTPRRNRGTQATEEDRVGGGGGGGQPRSPVTGVQTVNVGGSVLARRFCERAVQLGVGGLRVEFLSNRKMPTPDPVEHKTFLANPTRNRYKDVPCVEGTRVRLAAHPDGHDYVHANFVGTELDPKRFICAQGPNQTTVYDFWCMVVQEAVPAIVMLCNVVENNSPKCVQYWAEKEGDTVTHKDIIVRTGPKAFLDAGKSIASTTLTVRSPNRAELVVKHLHWLTWPDRGVPRREELVFLLLQTTRGLQKPVLVHCSAGIGRTGSIVLVEMVLARAARQIPFHDMLELVKVLRKQRANCIQTDSQYLFVHYALIRHFIRAKAVSPEMAGLQKFLEDYEKVVGPSMPPV